jgi:hypothetical protein
LFLDTCADDRSLEDIVKYAYDTSLRRIRKALRAFLMAFVGVPEGEVPDKESEGIEAKNGCCLRQVCGADQALSTMPR